MVYCNNFVVAIKVGNVAQRELSNGSVIIPDGSEYSIHLRNKNKERNAVAFVYIDGELVTPNGIVVDKNKYVDLERPLDKAVKFKFVSTDSPEAIEFGKNNSSDKSMGKIEVRWHYQRSLNIDEAIKKLQDYLRKPVHEPWYPPYREPIGIKPYMTWGHDPGNSLRGVQCASYYSASTSKSQQFTSEKYEVGCTVEGEHSDQKFSEIPMEIESAYTTISLTLVVQKPSHKPSVRTAARIVHGDKRSAPILEVSESTDVDLRVQAEREELIRLELELLALKKAKVQAEIDALKE